MFKFWPMIYLHGTNNPHIYAAYNDLALRLRGEHIERSEYMKFFLACTDPERPGVFYRWPGGRGGTTSHDECMGAAYFDVDIARSIVRYLDANGGEYDTHRKGRPKISDLLKHRRLTFRRVITAILASLWRWNLYRILWFRPYLVACSGYRPSILDELIWSIFCLRAAFTTVNISRVGPGRRLRVWLMAERMQHYPICRIAIRFWLWRINRSEATLSGDLRQEGGVPAVLQYAPARYSIPTGGIGA